MIRNSAHFNLILQNASLKLPKAILSTDPGNRHTPTTAPEPVRAFTGKCGMVRGPIKVPVMEKCFRPKATGNRQQATGNRQLYSLFN